MKILHLPTEISGQLHLTATAQRALGHDARSLTYDNQFGYPSDYNIEVSSNRLLTIPKKISRFSKFLKYDIYHYHFGNTLMPGYLDPKFLNARGKKVFTEFWGSDVRLETVEKKRNPYFISYLQEPDFFRVRKMKKWAEITNGIAIYPDHTFNEMLLPYFDRVEIVGQRVDLHAHSPVYPDPELKVPTIVHAPSRKAIKGTVIVEKAIENLKRKKILFNYTCVEGLTNAEAMEKYKKADLIIDQMMLGSHGVFACEAMALGKPTICNILPQLIDGFPKGFPIINANPSNLESVIEQWITSPHLLHEKGMESRAYAERVHDPLKVAKRLNDVYEGKSVESGQAVIDRRKEIF